MTDKDKLFWVCHICLRQRPNEKISVLSKPIDFGLGVIAKQNVRYCNDRPECIEGAKDYSHIKRSPK